MTKTRKKSKIITIVVYVIFLVFVLGAVGFFYYNTDGFKTGVRTLYLTCDNKIMDSKVLQMKESQDYNFDIVSLADLDGKSAIDYDIRIAPNMDIKSIRYLVGDEDYNYLSISDYAPAFDITKNARGFTIKQSEWDIAKILSKMHDGASIEFPEPIEAGVYFCVVVTIKNKIIRFDLTAKLTDIEFDKGVQFP